MVQVSAQVSVYPLRQEHLTPASDDALGIFRRHELNVKAGTMSTLIVGDNERVLSALEEAFDTTCRQGEVVMVVTLSNSCPVCAPPIRDRARACPVAGLSCVVGLDSDYQPSDRLGG
jgi:uncharacterized protein YqgV (UPF0045/DUF77 family)